MNSKSDWYLLKYTSTQKYKIWQDSYIPSYLKIILFLSNLKQTFAVVGEMCGVFLDFLHIHYLQIIYLLVNTYFILIY